MSHYIEGACANCDSEAVTVQAPLFCSEQCRQAAHLVRYVRARRREDRDQEPDIREAIQMRMAMVLGGGYPERARQVPDAVRAAVFEQAAGRCENCGRELDSDGSTGDPDALATIQHVAGDSNDIENLKAFCRRCNNADAQAKFVPVMPGSPEALLASQLRERWLAAVPLRLCDDDQRWNDLWRKLTKAARETVEQREFFADSGGDEDLPGFRGWTDQGTPIQDC